MRNLISLCLFALFSAMTFGKGVFTISPASLNFGTVSVGNTLTLPATITNTGNSILVISNITSSDGQFTFTANFPIRILEGQSTMVHITFTPTGTGLQSGNLLFSHNGTGSTTSYAVSGTGYSPMPIFSIDPVSLSFGTVNVGSSASLPVTIANSGDAPLIISAITSSDAQYTFNGIVPIAVAPGNNTTIDVTFTPTGEGSYPADLSFIHNASGSPAVLPLTGTGHILTAGFNINPASLSFGIVNVGSSETLPVTISNSGDASLIISNISSSDPQYTFSGIVPITVPPGNNTSIDVTFTPIGEGSYPADLSLTHNGSVSPEVLPLTGTGHILTAGFNINPASLSFGTVNVGSSETLPVTISNSGDASLIISNISSSDPQYTFSGIVPITVPPGNNTTIDVTFTPTGEGSYPADLSFIHNASGSPAGLVLTGTGHIQMSAFNIEPVSLNFGTVNVGSSFSLPVTISNSGDASLIISNISSSGPQYTFSVIVPITITPGSNTSIDVTFTPTGEGSFPAALTFIHNASGSPSVLPLTGTGHILTAGFNINPASLSFGTVNVGNSETMSVIISNSGDAPLIISAITSSDPQYTFNGIIPITVAPGGNTTIDVTFIPTGEGSYPADLSLTHNGSGSPAVLPLTGTGHILTAGFNINPASLSFGTINVGNFVSLPVTISNSGDASLIISSITSSDPQYTFNGIIPITVAPGDSTTFDVTFTPTGEGSFPAALTFIHNASGSPAGLILTGTGHIQMSAFNIEPVSLNFGTVNVGSSFSLPVTISNSGDASLIISDITSSDLQYTYTSASLPIAIPAGQSSIVEVTFAPAAGGVISAALTFTHNAAGGSTLYNIQGSGLLLRFPLTVNVVNGWNMVSIPGLHPLNQEVLTWWSGKDPLAYVFTYLNRLVPVQTLVPGKGYWLKNAGANTYNTGDEWPTEGINIVPNDPIPGSAGWNMIGGYNNTVSASEITTDPPNSMDASVFSYSNGYQVSDSLYPGRGYWVRLNQAAQIIFPSGSTAGLSKLQALDNTWGKITLSDKGGKHYTLYAAEGEVNLNRYELPPAPPAGMFDVRFGSQRYVENLSEQFQSMEFSGVEYPVIIRVENIGIRLQNESGRGINIILKPGEELSISDSEVNKLMVSAEIVPDKYTLEQNYPNPFNPNTLIQFTLPVDANNVNLTIYNALGEKVAELIDRSLQAGYHKYQWNAGTNASGIYIYQLKTENFVSTKKMMLMK